MGDLAVAGVKGAGIPVSRVLARDELGEKDLGDDGSIDVTEFLSVEPVLSSGAGGQKVVITPMNLLLLALHVVTS